MKTEKNILIAFILNLSFSLLEFVGGIWTGSVSIVSDAVHDLGDAISIGISFFLEKKSKKQPDETYTYGYARYSVLGGTLTALFLLLGSVIVIHNAVRRMIHPTAVNYDGMILFAIIGLCINLCAALVTRNGKTLNQKAVNLHMLEDVLGWVVVLVGAITMRFTDFVILDPVLSIAVALFILINAIRHLTEAVGIFLGKAPSCIDVNEVKQHLSELTGVIDVHHIHLWTMDGQTNCATMHIVTNADSVLIKESVRNELKSFGIAHATLELEIEGELCPAAGCCVAQSHDFGHHYHHHHHH